MASFTAALRVDGRVYALITASYGTNQDTGQRGRASAKKRFRPTVLLLIVPDDDFLAAWAADPAKRHAADLVLYDADGGQALETLHYDAAYCVGYAEDFRPNANGEVAYLLTLTLTSPEGWTLTPGGPANPAAIRPLPGTHGSPVAIKAPEAPPVRKQTSQPASNPMNPERMALWRGYLERRGVRFFIGTPEAELKLYDYRAVGFYSGGPTSKTIFLHDPPNTATFFEEAFHALQDLRNHPTRKVLENGEEVDAWEYDAKQALLRHSVKLGLSYEEYIETERQLQQVVDGTYGDY